MEENSGSVSVVMLDDQVEVYERIADSLSNANIDARFASDYGQALAYIKARKPNVILCDVYLGLEDPVGEGLKLLEEIVNSSDTFYIPVIMYSGDNRKNIKTNEKAYSLGAESYLRKPHNHLELVSAIRNAANKYSPVQRELASQFVPKLDLLSQYTDVPITYALNVALIASQRNSFASYNYLSQHLQSHSEIKLTVYNTPHAFYENVEKYGLEYDAVISCMPELDLRPVIDGECVTTIYYMRDYRDVMSNGCYDYYFHWDNKKNTQPLFHHLAVAVRNHRRIHRLVKAVVR